jgi:hypothetical protein
MGILVWIHELPALVFSFRREVRGWKGRKDIREGDGDYEEGRKGVGKGERKGAPHCIVNC